MKKRENVLPHMVGRCREYDLCSAVNISLISQQATVLGTKCKPSPLILKQIKRADLSSDDGTAQNVRLTNKISDLSEIQPDV